MSSLLDSTNPHGIRVVADRAPSRPDVQAAFLKASRKATTGIAALTGAKGTGKSRPASPKAKGASSKRDGATKHAG